MGYQRFDERASFILYRVEYILTEVYDQKINIKQGYDKIFDLIYSLDKNVKVVHSYRSNIYSVIHNIRNYEYTVHYAVYRITKSILYILNQ